MTIRPSLARLTLLLVTVSATPAAAQSSQPRSPASQEVRTVESLYAEGAALFKGGDYRAALQKFEAAYKVIPVANLLYNIARCLEALGEVDRALAQYKLCMDSAEASAEARVAAAQRYEALVKARVTAAKAARPATPAAPTASAAEAPRPSSGHKIAAWTSLAVGAALLIAGGVTYGLGASDHSQITSLTGYGDPTAVLPMSRARAVELSDSGTTKKTAGVVLLGVGGAAAATSVVLFLLAPRAERAQRAATARLLPQLAPGQAGLALQGAF